MLSAFAEGDNVGRPTHAWTKLYTRTMGFYDRVAMSRVLRWSSFDDKGAARLSIDALLAHDFEGLIVGHGDPMPTVGREALAAATSWLPATPARLSAAKHRVRRCSLPSLAADGLSSGCRPRAYGKKATIACTSWFSWSSPTLCAADGNPASGEIADIPQIVAERGGNIGSYTQRLNQRLERFSARQLDEAIAAALARETPHRAAATISHPD